MNGNCTNQFNFMKQYFGKTQIAQQLQPDDLNDIFPENFEEATTTQKQHQRFYSDQLTKASLTKYHKINNNSQSTDISNLTLSYKSILKKPNSNQCIKQIKSLKKVHFSKK